ncbi:DUF6173 family protein [uncultured Psychrobacter sp.]|jgi:hypothetical protein|uniref:DUF6173 family protein n=1 Tax=uncultured Psychrobacter sp. TaxID=259303 RepID=UPI0030DCE761|tara:strand:+ start:272 stop:664 length:393 start_codon:yes stop_codon:yes gene_type:complete
MSDYSKLSTLSNNQRILDVMQEQREIQERHRNPVIQIRESLERQVRDFESKLNEEQEVMLMAASFGSSITFYVDSIEFNEPSMIIFHGTTTDGGPTRLIQHCNQLSFLLQAVPKQDPDEKRVPIGFIHNE